MKQELTRQHRMNICLVMVNDGWAGAETVVYNLAKKLRKQVNVILLLNGEVIRYFSHLENVKIFQIGSLYDTKSLITSTLLHGTRDEQKSELNSGARRRFQFYFLNDLLRYFYCKRISHDILKILTQEKVDVIHLHDPWSLGLLLPVSKQLNIPTVYTIHDGRIFDQFNLIERAMMTKGLARVNTITCVSKYVRRVLKNLGVPFLGKPIVIPNGVDIEEIREDVWEPLGNPLGKTRSEKEYRLLFSGGGKPWKGGSFLIESLPSIKTEIPNVHLYVAGAVPAKHSIRRLVKERKLENCVTFLGFLPPHRYYQVLSSVDLFVSTSRAEAFGLVLLEAMTLGKPIVATRTGGVPEIIKNMENGMLVNRDPNSIAEAIIYMHGHKNLCEKFSQNNLESVKAYDWDIIIDKYITLYETLLD